MMDRDNITRTGARVPGVVVSGRREIVMRFYEICSNRVLRFGPLADAVLTDVTGELIGKYAQWRRSTSADDSILTVNGELRTLRRMMRLAHEVGLNSAR